MGYSESSSAIIGNFQWLHTYKPYLLELLKHRLGHFRYLEEPKKKIVSVPQSIAARLFLSSNQ